MRGFRFWIHEAHRIEEDHWAHVAKDPYVYHTSPKENHESIRKHGLTSKSGVAKNGKHFKWDVNFATKRADSKAYAEGGHTYRVKYSHLKEPTHDPIAGYVRTQHDVPPEHVEHHDGTSWRKLK